MVNPRLLLFPKTTFLIIFLLFAGLGAFSQGSIKGKVMGEGGHTLSGATVILGFGLKDSLKTTTGEDGAFQLRKPSTEFADISISYVGYTTLHQKLKLDTVKSSLNFQLISGANLLEGVTLESNKVQIKEDTVSYLIDSTMYRKNDNVEEVLKKLPGVTVDKDGTVTAQGKQVTKVKVNGKDFFNGDVTTATRELNADMVDRIQIIDDYGDQAAFTGIKDGDPSKTLNIELKKDRNKGYFGNITAGAGTEQRYLGKLSLNIFQNDKQISIIGNLNNTNANTFDFGGMGLSPAIANMVGGAIRSFGAIRGGTGTSSTGFGLNDGISTNKSIGVNYRDQWGKKVSVYGSYSYSHRNTFTDKQISQQNFFAETSNLNTQDLTDRTSNDNHRFNFNIEYRIDSLNYLKISPGFTYNNADETSNTLFAYRDTAGRKTNDGSTNQYITNNSPSFNGSILYNHKFRKKGRNLSISASGNSNVTDNGTDYSNLMNIYTPFGVFDTTLNQFIDQSNRTSSYSIRGSYIEPLDKKRSLEFSYGYTHQYTGNDRRTYEIDQTSSAKTYLDSLSNIYDNEYETHRIGFNFRTNERKFNYTLGLAVQPATIKSNSETGKYEYMQHLVNYYPVVRLAYNFSRSRSLNINYNGSTSQPNYQQLQPVTDYSNPQYLTVGNPNLRPEFNNTFSLRYNNFDFITGDVFFSNISFSFTRDKIVNNTFNKGPGIQETRYLNTNGYYTVFGFYNYSKPFNNRKYVINYGGNVTYFNNISYLEDRKNRGANWLLSQRLSSDIKIKKWLETTIGGSYSLNSTHYSLQKALNNDASTWTIQHSSRLFLPKNFRVNYDMEKNFNAGFASTVNAAPFIINASVEKSFGKKEQLALKLQGFDLLNENQNISRSVTASAITDSRVNRLRRYYLLTAIYRLNKFSGSGSGRPMMMGGPGMSPMGGPGGSF